MKSLLTSAIIAAVVSLGVLYLDDVFEGNDDDRDNTVAAPTEDEVAIHAAGIRYTDALIEDTWINGARTPGGDRRTLSDAANSICYLTKVEIKGVQGPEDSNSCAIDIDDFTGHWELVATVEEGGQSEVRCNARCLIWE